MFYQGGLCSNWGDLSGGTETYRLGNGAMNCEMGQEGAEVVVRDLFIKKLMNLAHLFGHFGY